MWAGDCKKDQSEDGIAVIEQRAKDLLKSFENGPRPKLFITRKVQEMMMERKRLEEAAQTH